MTFSHYLWFTKIINIFSIRLPFTSIIYVVIDNFDNCIKFHYETENGQDKILVIYFFLEFLCSFG